MDPEEQEEYARLVDNGWYEEAEDFQRRMSDDD